MRDIRSKHHGNQIYCHAQPYRDPNNPKAIVPQWQIDMARWCNAKSLFTIIPFEEYEPRKGFKCSAYIEQFAKPTDEWAKTKEKFPGTVVFVRSADNYTCYGEDAPILQQIFGIPITNEASGRSVVRFPRAELTEHLCKVICAGKRVAIIGDEIAQAHTDA
jgi:hypothetical protein